MRVKSEGKPFTVIQTLAQAQRTHARANSSTHKITESTATKWMNSRHGHFYLNCSRAHIPVNTCESCTHSPEHIRFLRTSASLVPVHIRQITFALCTGSLLGFCTHSLKHIRLLPPCLLWTTASTHSLFVHIRLNTFSFCTHSPPLHSCLLYTSGSRTHSTHVPLHTAPNFLPL